MSNPGKADPPKDFAHAFGDALSAYLDSNRIGQSAAARLLGIEANEKGKRKGGSRIYSYCRDSKDGKRTKPDAEILYLACTRLQGFAFVYNGYRISAATLNGNGTRASKSAEQLSLDFGRQFNLTGNRGTVAVSVKRPPGRIELSISMDAKA
jgi:hypothetical protein